MARQNDVSRLVVVGALVLATGGCAVFGGGGGPDVGTPEPAVSAADDESNPQSADTAVAASGGSMEDRLLSGDYAGALALFAADSSLHTDEDALYRAGLAAAMSGHPGHDPRRATRLFRQLLELHPDTEHRLSAELHLEMIARERDLRTINDRLERELRQLKAIDLGQEPEESDP